MRGFEVDIDALSKASKEYEDQLGELNRIKKEISETLKTLKDEGWNSKAGEACMKKFDDNWAKELDKYINLVDFLKDILKQTKPELEKLVDKANSLQSID